MKITDPKVKKLMKRANSIDLDERVYSFPEEERDGLTDMDIFIDELAYLVDLYDSDGTIFSEDLETAREIMKATDNGKSMPLYPDSLLPRYCKYEVDNARDTINEYRRLTRLLKEVLS